MLKFLASVWNLEQHHDICTICCFLTAEVTKKKKWQKTNISVQKKFFFTQINKPKNNLKCQHSRCLLRKLSLRQ